MQLGERFFRAASAGVFALVSFISIAHAAKFQTLYSFCSQPSCADGQVANGGVIADSAGNLYGTSGGGGANGSGTVFRRAPDGTQTVLYSFCQQPNCADGASPFAGVIMDKSGNLYGTTVDGGSKGHGTVFEIAADGKETVLYSFCQQANCADGANPYGGLIVAAPGKNKAASGKVIGMTSSGGNHGAGVAFEVTTGGKESVLYSFCQQPNCADGANPMSGLVSDTAGNLYGTTEAGGNTGCGGSGCGTVFEIPAGGKETVLYSFCQQPNCADGANPYGGLIVVAPGKNKAADGKVIGMSSGGGNQGEGTAFSLEIDGIESVLYSFCQQPNCADGANPMSGLVSDEKGNLYGTTQSGGTGSSSNCTGCGTVFKLPTAGGETVLHSFCSLKNCSDGGSDLAGMAGLYFDTSTKLLYGTTPQGGASGFDSGTVFAVPR